MRALFNEYLPMGTVHLSTATMTLSDFGGLHSGVEHVKLCLTQGWVRRACGRAPTEPEDTFQDVRFLLSPGVWRLLQDVAVKVFRDEGEGAASLLQDFRKEVEETGLLQPIEVMLMAASRSWESNTTCAGPQTATRACPTPGPVHGPTMGHIGWFLCWSPLLSIVSHRPQQVHVIALIGSYSLTPYLGVRKRNP